MKLYISSASPYVRKALVAIIEAGLDDEVERVTPSESVWVGAGDAEVLKLNPLGKIPTLVVDDCLVLTDSTLICEYIAAQASDRELLPAGGDRRWRVLANQTLAQGVMDAAISKSLETQLRPDELAWPEWMNRQQLKIDKSLDRFEALMVEDKGQGYSLDVVDLATITLGCALGYLSQRLGDDSWQDSRSQLSPWFEEFVQRPSMVQTAPPPLPPAHLDPRKA